MIEYKDDTHQYFVDGVEYPSVTTVLNYLTLDHYQAIDKEVLRLAGERGSAVHEACEVIDYGGEPDIYAEIVPFVQAYVEFLRDYRPNWYGIEQIGVGDGYCGTIDRWGLIDGKMCVLDIKTNSSPTKENYISVCCQTSAYALMLDKKIEKRYALYLKKDGDYRLVDLDQYETDYGFNGRELFMNCKHLYDLIKEIKGRKKRK